MKAVFPDQGGIQGLRALVSHLLIKAAVIQTKYLIQIGFLVRSGPRSFYALIALEIRSSPISKIKVSH